MGVGDAPPSTRARPHLGADLWVEGPGGGEAGSGRSVGGRGRGAVAPNPEPSLSARAPASAGGSARESWKVEETTNSRT